MEIIKRVVQSSQTGSFDYVHRKMHIPRQDFAGGKVQYSARNGCFAFDKAGGPQSPQSFLSQTDDEMVSEDVLMAVRNLLCKIYKTLKKEARKAEAPATR